MSNLPHTNGIEKGVPAPNSIYDRAGIVASLRILRFVTSSQENLAKRTKLGLPNSQNADFGHMRLAKGKNLRRGTEVAHTSEYMSNVRLLARAW